MDKSQSQPVTLAPDPDVKSRDQPMDHIFKAVAWSEEEDERQQNERRLSLEAQGQDKVTRWMRDGLQYGVLYCDLLPDISSVVRPVDKSGSYMDMLPWWNPDYESSATLTTTERATPIPQVKTQLSPDEQHTDDIKREKAFHDLLTKAGGRPWYSRELIDKVAQNPEHHAELLGYWKQDTTGSGKQEWMVFERQLERWNQFCRYQLRVRRNRDTFDEYLARCTKCLSKQSLTTPLHMRPDPADQDPLSQWLEYLCFEVSDRKKYSWYKRYNQQYESAWQTLVDSKLLELHEDRGQIEAAEYTPASDGERTKLRQAVEVASSNVLLAERDLLDPSVRGPVAQRKLFETQAKLDSAIEAFDHFQRRGDAIKAFLQTTSAYREARRGALRHQMLLRWMRQQVPLIEEDLGLPPSTGHSVVDAEMLLETDSDESDDQKLSIDSSRTELMDTLAGLQRNESKKRLANGLNDRCEMANPPPVRRGSSTGHLPLPPQPLAPVTSTPSKPPPRPHTTKTAPPEIDSPVHPSLLQPRVAVVLNVPKPWHPWLFALRLFSILPALWWGLPSALQLLLRVLPGPEIVVVVPSTTGGSVAMSVEADARYALTETGLATIWCFASGYLSFFFTDCLMSRWLINYTPQATMVRLLTTNFCNAYLTAFVLSFTGGFQDPRLLLPGWVGIATTLTMMYHVTHQKINIRKETSTSINVFSIACSITMVTLLVHLHQSTPDYPQMPIVASGRRAFDEASRVITQIRGSIEQHEDL
ncbi:uncharacterized protein FSUBG_7653 [Fusarium subglutinans]|uniref:Uncharacterized protein n=1 Tax=Gibberella subglutinans TaxID=42677 RepID=A0A8H5PUA7_GIBSU|nr:uncharacterized protein FSUBG_7653 [Fusarium subglutinans]KAF5602602.1 hypothetical protein FSUBG_7653 [Fusarium subglutinans]